MRASARGVTLPGPARCATRCPGALHRGSALRAAGAGGTAGLHPGLSLLIKSLLQHEADSPSLDGEPRLSMLATIREFGLELLDASEEAEAVGHAHAAS